MNCLEIIKAYLKEHGFDGLQNGECGCEISDLIPCDCDCSRCRPGYKVLPPDGRECEFDFYICDNKDDEPWGEEEG